MHEIVGFFPLNHLEYSKEEVHFQCAIVDNDLSMKSLSRTVKYAF